MKNTKVTLVPLTEDDREQFIIDNQWAFKYGAIEEFGKRDDHLDFDGEIIIEADSYAQNYFEDFYGDDYNLVVASKPLSQEPITTSPTEGEEKLFCRRCGTQLPLDSDFCFKCGTEVTKEVLC